MNSGRLFLKFAVLVLGLAILHLTTTPVKAYSSCPSFPVFCSTATSAGHCGYRPGEDCDTCYARDGSTETGGCGTYN